MHNTISKFTLCVLACLFAFPAFAAVKGDTPQKREMRSAWVATVWRIDWPPSVISQTGSESQIKNQQKALSKMLDSLQVNNFNAINLQVRSRCDAFYKSSYEPWSSDLVSSRGMDPGWDPLAWAVDECHKRGMECHAWINPYRYESQAHQWDGTPRNYRESHPEWLMDVTSSSGTTATILNPGLPEVRQRICDVVREIVTNYDVDGLLFDDYFYLSGTNTSHDGDLYDEYKANGGTLSIGDWRRENVNQMISDVYNTIKEAKPWVRFGVSPAGVAATSNSVASKYGVTACPAGSDWQYNDIYSDPLAWLSRNTLDYLSPQVYWRIGAWADYGKITPWWYKCANKFGRHIYISHGNSDMSGGTEEWDKMVEEIRLNRTSDSNNPGTIWYSVKNVYTASGAKFGHYLLNRVFNTPALIPAMTWQSAPKQGLVKNLQRNGNTITWDPIDNVRYTLYAYPSALPIENFDASAEYLMGTSYATTYDIPQKWMGAYNYAVCVLDRYGNEYSAAFVGREAVDLDAPALVSPANNATVEYPFEFSWKAVDKASQYVVEVANDAKFTNMVGSKVVAATTCSSTDIAGLEVNHNYYWRVVAQGVSANDGISEARTFTMTRMDITFPTMSMADVPLTPTITWSNNTRDVDVIISRDADFTDVVLNEKGHGGSYTVPAYVLSGFTEYYLRLGYELAGVRTSTDDVVFKTVEVTPANLAISYPVDGGEFFEDDFIHVTPVEGYSQITIQLDTKEAVGARFVQETTYIPTWHSKNQAGSMGRTLEKGTTYYMRVRGAYQTASGKKSSEWSPVISAVFRGENNGVEEIASDELTPDARFYNLQGMPVANPAAGQIYIVSDSGKSRKLLLK